MQSISVSYKSTDKEGRIRLGAQHANKQWQMKEYESGCLLLVPMIPVSDEEAIEAFEKVMKNHKISIDGLK